ncbi:AbrB/MazE/SpoVT family DNA-binding domain-containing protein [Lipingzhangella rawalii]|uniref:AbrB/MazE/SpoVT family DNA-binding domain-containing protein n=1 Tax=Lipingzhangella rawalii TaxID=2055835 RepID=UPI003898E15B
MWEQCDGECGFYGAVTVSERGQIVIPAQARRDLGIDTGDKLLVLGDPERGIALMTMDLLMRNLDTASPCSPRCRSTRSPGPVQRPRVHRRWTARTAEAVPLTDAGAD